MKKSSKILGSIALSAALMMGTAVPAFAAPDKPVVPGDRTGGTPENVDANGAITLSNGAESGSSTVVTVSTYTSQLNVTVPLYLPIWLDTAGGDPIVPDTNAYFIQNNSPVSVKVDKAVYKNLGIANITFASSTSTLGQDEFWIKLSPADKEELVMDSNAANNPSGVGANKPFTTWIMGPQTDASAKLVLPVSASSGTISHAINDAKLASIVYTVSVNGGGIIPNNGDGENATVTPPSETEVRTLVGTNAWGDVVKTFTDALSETAVKSRFASTLRTKIQFNGHTANSDVAAITKVTIKYVDTEKADTEITSSNAASTEVANVKASEIKNIVLDVTDAVSDES